MTDHLHSSYKIHTAQNIDIEEFIKQSCDTKNDKRLKGLCGFDGFIDTFISMKQPSTMAAFGPKVTASAGISTSFSVEHQGDKFGGNGPLFASAIHSIFNKDVDVTYAGAVGDNEVQPIFRDALESRMTRIYPLAAPAHSTCIEFSDGKVMLSDMRACERVTWERLVESIGMPQLDSMLGSLDFISAVNWGKLPHAAPIWTGLVDRLIGIHVPPKKIYFFMDLAEFETRSLEDRTDLLRRLEYITSQCTTLLSFNLKEAWQMAEVFNENFFGYKDPESIIKLTAFLKSKIQVDRVIVHPNDGAAISDGLTTHYVPGPYCNDPLISTGAGDNFGAGCLAAALCGMSDEHILLGGNAASGFFVRTGHSATFIQMAKLLKDWSKNKLADRLDVQAI